MRFGANYVPSGNWWYSWTDWNGGSVRRDLESLAALGLDHIRIHCLWPVFQPNPNMISPTALNRLEEILDMADCCGLDVQVTVLDGWLSGFAFYPSWLGGRSMFTDPGVIEAEKRLFTAIADAAGEHPRFMGFDLGNELGVLHHFGQPLTVAQGDEWHRELMSHCGIVAPKGMHTSGVDHQQWFGDTGFSRRCLASTGDITSVHAWIEFTGARGMYGWDGVGSLHLAEYCVELAKAYSPEPGRPVWVQEFGASSQWMPESAIPGFARTTMDNAATCSDLWGFTWWCSHDLSDGLEWFHPLEYDLGLFDQHGVLKPVGQALAELVADHRKSPPTPLVRSTALVIDDGMFAGDGNPSPGWRVGRPFMELVRQGVRPAVVLAERTADKDYLEARGITELVAPGDATV